MHHHVRFLQIGSQNLYYAICCNIHALLKPIYMCVLCVCVIVDFVIELALKLCCVLCYHCHSLYTILCDLTLGSRGWLI